MRHSIDDGSQRISPNGFLETLRNCGGYYSCPVDSDGMPLGPVVGYAGTYDADDGPKKHWVGLDYLNFSMADQWPAVLTYFAREMVNRLVAHDKIPDVIIGGPWAGIKFSQEVARLLGCRHIFAEKKVVGWDSATDKPIEEIALGRYEGAIGSGDLVIVGEELVNNLSTTGKIIGLCEVAGGQVVAVTCAINRSSPAVRTYRDIPVIGVVDREIPQYRQDDPIVVRAIADGNVVWKPKHAWSRLEAAMRNNG